MAKGPLIRSKTIDKWLFKASSQLQREDYISVINTDYKPAQANLAMVEKARAEGVTPRVVTSDPFANTKTSITFYSE